MASAVVVSASASYYMAAMGPGGGGGGGTTATRAISKARDIVAGGESKSKGTDPGPTEVVLGVALCPPLDPPPGNFEGPRCCCWRQKQGQGHRSRAHRGCFGGRSSPPPRPPPRNFEGPRCSGWGQKQGQGHQSRAHRGHFGGRSLPSPQPPPIPPARGTGGGGTRKGPRASTHSGRSGCSGSGIESVDQGGVGAGAQGRREDPIEVTDAPPRLARACGRRGLVRPRSSPEAPEGGGEPVQEVEGGATPTGGSCSPEPSLHPRHHAVRPRALLHL